MTELKRNRELELNTEVRIEEAELPVDRIVSSGLRGRRSFNPDAIRDLAASMMLVGLLQRIAVRQTATGWEVIYGRRRLLAAQQLEWKTIPVRIIHADDAAALVVFAAENLHRDALGLIDCADIVLQLVEGGLTQRVVSRVLTRSEDWVSDVLLIARDPTARAMAEAGLLAVPRAWRELMRLPGDVRRRLLDAGEPISVAACERERKRLEADEQRRQTALFNAHSDRSERSPTAEHPRLSSLASGQRPKLLLAHGGRPTADAPIDQGASVESMCESDEACGITVPVDMPIELCAQLVPDARAAFDAFAATYRAGRAATIEAQVHRRIVEAIMSTLERRADEAQ